MKNKNIHLYKKTCGRKGTRLFIFCIHKPLLKKLLPYLWLSALTPFATFVLLYEAQMTLATIEIPDTIISPVMAEEQETALCGLDVVECPSERQIDTLEGVPDYMINDISKQIYDISKQRNFRFPEYLIRLAWCESSHNPRAVGDGSYYSRGLYQISKFYHPSVSDECSFDIACSTNWTIDKINAGGQGIWSCDKQARRY